MNNAGRVVIYGLTDPRTGAVRYVGKANDAAKRLQTHIRDARRSKRPVNCWVRKLTGLGLAPGLIVLEEVDGDWRDAERRIIAQYRALGPLLNVADGGDQPLCPSDVQRANALKMNAKRRADPIVNANRNVLCMLGRTVFELRKLGKAEKANRMSASLERIKVIAKTQPDWLFDQFAAKPRFRASMRLPRELAEALG